MFKRPALRKILSALWPMGLVVVCQLPNLYVAAKNKNILLFVLGLVAVLCGTGVLVKMWMHFSRLSEGGPALWLDKEEFVVSVDKTVRIRVADIQDYRFIVSAKTRQPIELKLDTHNGKTRTFPLDDIDNIAPLVGFMRRLVPGKA